MTVDVTAMAWCLVGAMMLGFVLGYVVLVEMAKRGFSLYDPALVEDEEPLVRLKADQLKKAA